MKKTILLAFGILMPLFIFSQIGFQQFYGRPNTYQEFRAILPLSDGSFLAGGTDGRGGHDFWIVKTDSLGNKNWEKHFGTEIGESLYYLNQMPDGGYLLIGRQSISITNHQIYIIRLNANFEEIWSRKITDNEIQNQCFSSHAENDGSITLAITNYADSTTTAQITRLFPDGNIEWEIFPSQVDKIYGLTTTQDNHLLLHGEKTDSLDNHLSYILKTDKNGTIIWTKRIEGSYSTGSRKYLAINEKNSANHILLTNRTISKFDDEGEILWQFYIPFNENLKIEEIGSDSFLIYRQQGVYEVKVENNILKEELIYDTIIYNQSIFLDGFTTSESEHIYVGRFFNQDFGRDAFIIKNDINQNEQWTALHGDLAPLDDEHGATVVQTPDNGYVMGGNGRFPSTGQDFYFAKTDSVGNVEWEINYDAGSNSPITDRGILEICLTEESDLILAGWSESNSDSSYLTIIKTDLSGNIIWDKKYKFRRESESLNCNSLSDTSLIFTFSVLENNTGHNLIHLNLNKNGELILLNASAPDSVYKYIHNTILTSNESLLSAGIKSQYDSLWLFNTDLNGNFISEFFIPLNRTSYYPKYNIIENSNFNYFVPYLNETNDSLYIINIASDFSNYEEKLLTNDFSFIENLNIDRIANNQYLLSFLANENYFYIMHINEELEILEIHEYNKLESQKINDTQAASDNSLILFGDANNINTRDWYLIKTWPNGVVQTINIQPLGKLDIYPNPSPNELSINFESDLKGDLEIAIINSNGQQLRHFTEIKNSTIFEKKYGISDLPSGAYFIRLTAEGKSISRTWIKP